ncbi:MAG: malto-oligosyltrehalose trehalohydrolase [Acidobacteriaceae bacterium]
MHTFKVWAPLARSLAVETGGRRHPMEQATRGWWSASVAAAGPGTDYAFIVNGEEPAVPDPRSQWQPQGIHGPSRIYDHAAFQWTDGSWQAPPLAGGVIYEAHVGTFTPAGTLDAAIGKLDYLKELGITHVEWMPLATAPGDRGWGYDGVDLFAPLEAYGGPDATKRFVDAAHTKGLAVLIDVVYNHFGPVGNYVNKFGPYTTESHVTPWGGAVNFEGEDSDGVRRFFCDNALMWLRDYHFDGLRVDAVHAFIDRSAIHFLEQLGDEVKALGSATGRHYVVIAESDLNDPRLVSATEAGGYGLDAQWSDDFHHALWTVLTGETIGYYQDFGGMADLARALREVFVYQGQYAPYRRRNHGRPVLGLPGYRFLGFIQNHDQIGNRAQGERLGHVVDIGRVKIAAALVLTSPFVPMLFAGEEFAASTPFQYFTDHHDPEMGRLVSEGRKKEFAAFGWKPDDVPDPQDKATFDRSKLNWSEITEQPHAEVLEWHRRLIALRRSHRSLTDGRMHRVDVRFDEQSQWLVVRRGQILVACNFGNDAALIELPDSCKVLLASGAAATHLTGAQLSLPSETVAVLAIVSDDLR